MVSSHIYVRLRHMSDFKKFWVLTHMIKIDAVNLVGRRGYRADKWTIQIKDRIVVDDPVIEWEDVEIRVDKEFVEKKRWNI